MASKYDEDLQHILTKNLEAKLDKLYQVWDVIGLNSAQKTARIEVVALHLNNLLDEMVTEEEDLCERMRKNIQQCGDDIARLVQALGVTYEPPRALSNIELEKDLKKTRGTLEDELQERMTLYGKLVADEDRLCVMMSEKMLDRCPNSDVPSWQRMETMKRHIGELKQELDDRRAVFRSKKADIVSIVEQLESSADTSFERELICEDEQWFVPTTDNMLALKRYHEDLQVRLMEHLALVSTLRGKMERLWKRLQVPGEEKADVLTRTAGHGMAVLDGIRAEIASCEAAVMERLQEVVRIIKTELDVLWDKCHIAEAERDEFIALAAATEGEACLVAHENEATRMLAYYAETGEMLSLVEKWQKLFGQFLEQERKATNDPNRYSNRGGNLLKEEKARKRVEKTLPVVEKDICRKIDVWEATSGKTFSIRGIPFGEFIARSWDSHKQDKIKARTDRLQAKAALMKTEMKYGSRPSCTPTKKRLFPSNLTPNKSTTKRFWSDTRSTNSLADSTVSTPRGISSYSGTPSKKLNSKPTLYSSTPRNFSR